MLEKLLPDKNVEDRFILTPPSSKSKSNDPAWSGKYTCTLNLTLCASIFEISGSYFLAYIATVTWVAVWCQSYRHSTFALPS